MIIENSNPQDIEIIFNLYDNATKYQTEKSISPWPKFDRTMVMDEIKNKLQFKIVIDDQIACTWAITFADKQIWQEKDNNSSVYIHRIATNAKFKGQNLVMEIVKWAKAYAKTNHKTHIRMDTVGENLGLIAHYTKCGFDFVGLSKLQQTTGLPAHYQNATVSLFEIKI